MRRPRGETAAPLSTALGHEADDGPAPARTTDVAPGVGSDESPLRVEELGHAREAVAILGVVLAMQGYPAEIHLRFLVVGFLLVALSYPRIAEVEVALETAYGAKLSHAR